MCIPYIYNIHIYNNKIRSHQTMTPIFSSLDIFLKISYNIIINIGQVMIIKL